VNKISKRSHMKHKKKMKK